MKLKPKSSFSFDKMYLDVKLLATSLAFQYPRKTKCFAKITGTVITLNGTDLTTHLNCDMMSM